MPPLARAAALVLTFLLLFAWCAPVLEPPPSAVPTPVPMPPRPASQPPPPPPEPEPPPPEPEPQPDTLTLIAAGDIMAHWDQVESARRPDGSFDFTAAFSAVAGDLAGGYAVGNLETVFGGPGRGYSSYPRFSTPDAFGQSLKEAGFDFVTTCNNHSLDADGPGLIRTLERLDALGLAHTGTYATQEASREITVVEAGGMRIALLAFTFSTNGIPPPAEAPWMVNMLTEQKLADDLRKAKALDPDLTVVMPHMGNEYETYTRDVFLEWMERMLVLGADVVLASHPHVLQPMLVRDLPAADGGTRQGFIICSLGNFISTQLEEPRDESILLKLSFSRRPGERPVLERVSFVPIWTSYRDSTGAVNIRVVPVADALAGLAAGNPLGIRPQDADRLRRAHARVTALYLGESAPPEPMQREYEFWRRASQ